MTTDVLVVTGGHPFEAEPFFAMFDALDDIDWTGASAPESGHDVVVFYDMPGYRFTGDPDDPVHLSDPSAEQRRVIDDVVRGDTGLVFLHHAIAGWPTWPSYGELIGGRFNYRPTGDLPDSGYLLGVEHTVEIVDADHPVCAGVPASFALTDELYCAPVNEGEVTPLLRTTHPTAAEHYFSADHAIRGRMNDRTGWTHPPGSTLVGWTREVSGTRLVYLQPGDGPSSFDDAHYRRLLHNAIHWTSPRVG